MCAEPLPIPEAVLDAVQAGAEQARWVNKGGPPPVPKHIVRLVLECESPKSASPGPPGSPPRLPRRLACAEAAAARRPLSSPWYQHPISLVKLIPSLKTVGTAVVAAVRWSAQTHGKASPGGLAQSPPTAVVWVADSERECCAQCSRNFWALRRRHHCRSCGEIFCHDCSSTTVALGGPDKSERVCDACVGVHHYTTACNNSTTSVGAPESLAQIPSPSR